MKPLEGKGEPVDVKLWSLFLFKAEIHAEDF